MDTKSQHLLEQLRRCLSPHNEGQWWLGYSGGLDSTVLLHALVQLKLDPNWKGAEFVAVHINHGLSSEANRWQQHCEQQCSQWGVECRSERVEIVTHGEGLEAAARTKRYSVFAELMNVGDSVLLAHHRDDQAETLFLRLLRGAGAKGLGAMAEARPFATGQILRPLLGVSRKELLAYAQTHQLAWIEDDSNINEQFDRNFLRQTIIPQLERRWPQLSRRWSRTAQALRENEEVLAAMAKVDLQACSEQVARLGRQLDRKAFSQLSSARRHNVLRFWCEQQGLPRPEFKHLQTLDQDLAKNADVIAIQWASAEVRSFKAALYLLPTLTACEQCEPLLIDAESILNLPDHSQLVVEKGRGGLSLERGELQVRWRQGGERCQPSDRRHSQSLKKLLQEYELEPWLRDRIPLIYAGDELAGVGDLWICRGFEATEQEQGLHLRWIIRPNKSQTLELKR